MIGLEFILQNSILSYTELAEKLGIKKQNITRWIKGERKIPEKYLPILEEIFRVPSQYFQKEINEIDKLYIQKGERSHQSKKVNYDDTLISEELERVLQTMEGRQVKINIVGGINTTIKIKKFVWSSMKVTRKEEILKLLDEEDIYFDFYLTLEYFEEIETYDYEDGEYEIIFYGEEVKIAVYNTN